MPLVNDAMTDDQSPIVVEELPNGEKVVRNVGNNGYSFKIPQKWNAYKNEQSNVVVMEEDEPQNEMYFGPAVVIGDTNIDTLEDYLNTQDNLINSGVTITKNNIFYVKQVAVSWVKADYSTSYQPSNGEIVYIYHFSLNKNENKYFVIFYSALEEQTLIDNKDNLISIISDLI